jgi:carotenoid cleavage dioxygenase-like enzyme
MMTQSLNLFPNCIDVANTVLLRTRHAIYALFERDSPYRIQIQSESQTIHTEYKDSLGHGIGRVCAHSKYDDTTDTLETIDYHVAAKKIQYRQLDMSPGVDPAELLSLIEIPVKYIPITHDFIALDDSIIVLDSPFSMSVKSSDPSKIPLTFHNDLPTYFYVVNKRTREIDTYTYPEGIFIFHYAWTKVGEGVIEILAPVYRGLDINALDLKGTYSKLVLTKLDKTCRIHTTESLKPYNLEFPVRWEDSVILRHFHEKRGVGFVICNDLDIQHCIWLPKLSICGEPVVIHHLSEPWILCFTSDDTHSYISLLSMRGAQHIHIPILDRVQVGFHSIYLP